MSTSEPAYTADEVYRELVRLCGAAGLYIEYKPLDEEIAGCADANGLRIRMPDTVLPEFEVCQESAARVLGHELAHTVFNRMPNESLHGKTYNPLDFQSVEDNCDMIGDAFATLAEMIIMARQDAAWNTAPPGQPARTA